jgi:hypothetical protein
MGKLFVVIARTCNTEDTRATPLSRSRGKQSLQSKIAASLLDYITTKDHKGMSNLLFQDNLCQGY